jgi:hypothetical protein
MMKRVLMHTVLAALAAGVLTAQGSQEGLAVSGLWAVDTTFGPAVRGALIIDGRTPSWHAEIAAYDGPVDRDASTVHFRLPKGAGEFRGELRGESLSGFWIQPAGIANGTPYATPVRFTRFGANRWRGTVDPLEDRVRFFVSIQPRADGSLSAFITDPEFNSFRRRTYTVSVSADHVELRNTARPNDTLSGT